MASAPWSRTRRSSTRWTRSIRPSTSAASPGRIRHWRSHGRSAPRRRSFPPRMPHSRRCGICRFISIERGNGLMRVLVTGGAGFIGSAVCHALIARGAFVINVDKLTYAANPRSLDAIAHDPHYAFERLDICERAAMDAVLAKHQPSAVLHLAAESHVDRSITGAAAFIDTNIAGTYHLLEAARQYWAGLTPAQREGFRFVHVSTDEVYGSLGAEGRFHEDTPYRPSSPYSASKAASDHLA